MSDTEERLIRIEEKVDHLVRSMGGLQDTRERVIAMEAKAKGMWFAASIIAGFVSWVVSAFKG